jgi:general secretion pathway protein M
MDALRSFWIERAPRERLVLTLLGLVVGLALLFLLLIEPAWTGIARLERGLPKVRTDKAQLESLLGEVQQLKSRAQVATVSAQEARVTIEKSLAAAGLKATRVVPLSSGDLQITFANVPYAAFASWVAATERELGARTTSVVANAVTAPGHVDVELAMKLAQR